MLPVDTGVPKPEPNLGGRPGISDEQEAALERGRKLRRFGKSRIVAAAAIHQQYFGLLARFENGKPERSQIHYLSKQLK